MTDRDKFIMEAMGIKDDIIFCQQSAGVITTYDAVLGFATWRGFGILWEWSQNQKWWHDESFFTNTGEGHITDSGCCVIAMGRLPCLIDPDQFANAVHEFLKEHNG